MPNGGGDDYRALLDRIKTFGVVILSIMIDLFFLAIWILLHKGFSILIHYLLPQEAGLDSMAATVLKYVFTIFTLGIVLIYVCADFWSAARRILRKVR